LADIKSGKLTRKDIKFVNDLSQGKAMIAAADLKVRMNTYEKLVEESGIEVTGAGKAKVESAYNDLLLSFKEAANLGVLAGPDMDIIEGSIQDASKGFIKNIFTGGGATRKVKASITQAQAALNRATVQNLEQIYAIDQKFQGSAYIDAILIPYGDELLLQSDIAEMQAILDGFEPALANTSTPAF